jgi:hypothetical protein
LQCLQLHGVHAHAAVPMHASWLLHHDLLRRRDKGHYIRLLPLHRYHAAASLQHLILRCLHLGPCRWVLQLHHLLWLLQLLWLCRLHKPHTGRGRACLPRLLLLLWVTLRWCQPTSRCGDIHARIALHLHAMLPAVTPRPPLLLLLHLQQLAARKRCAGP